MRHLEENTIVGYATGNLPTDARDAVETHIDDCEECRRALALFVGRSSTPFAAAITGGSEASTVDAGGGAGMPKPGELLADRFTIVKHLGRGGMGHVFQASDQDLGIQVALKVLRPEITVDEEQIRHLRREILAGRKIAHPNVCRVFDLGKTATFHFITMELVSGVTLAERVREGAMPLADVMAVLRQLLGALGAAHAEGIVHRDLKPANVMLDATGKIKVMDFGLARDLTGEHSLKGQVGTPAYWSPEQSRGEAAGPAADFYAVGLIAYFLLVGETSTRKLRERVKERAPAELQPWILRCLEEEPTERFATASEAIAALPEVVARPPRRRWIVAAATVIGVAALGGVWLATTSHEPRPETHVTTPTPIVTDATIEHDAALPLALDAGLETIVDAGRPTGDAAVIRHRPHDAGLAKPDASLLFEP